MDDEINRRLEKLELMQARADDDRSRLWDIVKAFFSSPKDSGMQLGPKTFATIIGLGVIQGAQFFIKLFFS